MPAPNISNSGIIAIFRDRMTLSGTITNVTENYELWFHWGESVDDNIEYIGEFTQATAKFIAVNISPNTSYQFKVRATNTSGTSYSTTHNVTSPNTLLFASDLNPASDIAYTSATISCYLSSSTYKQNPSDSLRSIVYCRYGENPLDLNQINTYGQLFAGNGFNISLINLNSNTTYYYSIGAKDVPFYAMGGAPAYDGYYNEEAGLEAFTTLAYDPPTVSTNDAGYITQTAATIYGYISATGGENPTRYFEYGKTTGYELGSIDKGVGGVGWVSHDLSSLDTETLYYYRAYATNSGGTGYGDQKTFNTVNPVWQPSVTTDEPTNILSTSATLNGNISDAGGENPTRYFEYGKTTGYELGSIDKGVGGAGPYSHDLSGLDPATRYYYRAYVTNSAGTGYGDQQYFDTSVGSPSVTTNSATSVLSRSATINANVTYVGGENPTRYFRYGKTTGYELGSINKGNGGAGSYSHSLSGLDYGTLYYFQAYATNSGGTSYGSQVTFTTVDYPSVTTVESATNIDIYSATISGNISSTGGQNPTRFLKYGLTSACELGTFNKGAGSTGTFSQDLSSLEPYLLYYFQAYATNDAGTVYGEVKTFTTLKGSPVLTTNPADNISASYAELFGEVSNTGGENITQRGFEFGFTVSYGSTINETGTFGVEEFSLTTGVLTPDKLYHFRSYATNSLGTTYGNDRTFSTVTNWSRKIIEVDDPTRVIEIPNQDIKKILGVDK